MVDQLRKSGFSASRTIWDTNSIRTDATEEAIREAVEIVEAARKNVNRNASSPAKLAKPRNPSSRDQPCVDKPAFRAEPSTGQGVQVCIRDDTNASDVDAFSSDASSSTALSGRERRHQRQLGKRSSSQSKKRISPQKIASSNSEGHGDFDNVSAFSSADCAMDMRVQHAKLERQSAHLEQHRLEHKQAPKLDPAKAMADVSIVAAVASRDAEVATTAAVKALMTAEEARDQATSPVAAEDLRVSMLARAGRATQEVIALEASASAARLRERKATARLAMMKMVEHLRSRGLSDSTAGCTATTKSVGSTPTPVLMSHSGDLGIRSQSVAASAQPSGEAKSNPLAPYDENFLWKRQLDLDFDWESVPLSNNAEPSGEQTDKKLASSHHTHEVDEVARDWSWWAPSGQPATGAPLTTAERVALTLRELGIVEISDLDLVTRSDLESRFVPPPVVAQILAIGRESSSPAGSPGGARP